jgi:hypothetical protein
LNFDYGVKKTVNTVVVQMKEKDFLGVGAIKFIRVKIGLVFYGEKKNW